MFDIRNFFRIYTAILFGKVDSPELPEMTENFTQIAKYLTKLRETLINYVWEKYQVKKQ